LADPLERSTIARGWAMAVFLAVCYTLSIVDRQVIAFVATDIKRDLGISDFQLGLVQGFIFSICYALASVPLGWAIDRFRRTRVLGLCLLVWTGSTFACGLSGGFRSLVVARIGIGAGEAALTPGAFSLLADMLPRRQFAAASAVYSLGAPLAVALAALISGFILGSAVDGRIDLPMIGSVAAWRATFFAAALPGVLLGIVFFLLREPPRRANAAVGAAAEALLPFLRRRWAVYGAFALLGTLPVVLFYAFNAWNPSVLGRDFGWSPGRIGTTLGSIGAISGLAGLAIGGTLTSWLAHHRPARIVWILAGGHAIVAVCGFAALFVRSGGEYVAVAAVAVAIAPAMMMVGPVLLQIVTPPPLRGRMTALFLLVGTGAGAGAGPTVVGALSSFVFPQSHLALAVGTAALGAGLIGTIGFLALYPAMTRAARFAE
jgi:MFS family permease